MRIQSNNRSASGVKRLVREPLLHFLLIGLALFLYYGSIAPDGGDERRIVVSQAQVDEPGRRFEATWNRPPTAQELSGLVDSYVSDEVLYREGKTLGLDRDDPVIKRRVRQKLEVMAEEAGDRRTPTDAELTAYLNAHPERFAQAARVSFEQLYFDPSKPGVESRVQAASVRLGAGGAPMHWGTDVCRTGSTAKASMGSCTVWLRLCLGIEDGAAGTVDGPR